MFISYRRQKEWTRWTREHFCNILDAYLTQELSASPAIFADDQIEPGADWPDRLGEGLGRSRILLPIFSRDYFASDWCLHELDLMHGRLMQYPNSRLIVPVVVHDGDLIPEEIARIQAPNLSRYRNTDLQRNTPLYEQFSEAVKQIAPSIAAAIQSAPAFQDVWVDDCRSRFNAVYKAVAYDETRPTVHTLTLRPLPWPNALPRVTP